MALTACSFLTSWDGMTGGTGAASDGGLGDTSADGGGSCTADCGTPYCQGLHPSPTFCRDFDDGRLYSTDFELLFKRPDFVAADPGAWSSAPLSFISEVATGSMDRRAYMFRTFDAGRPRNIRMSFDVLMERYIPSQVASVVSIEGHPDQPDSRKMDVYLGADGSSIEERIMNPDGSAPQYRNYLFVDRQPRAGTWSHLDIRIDVPARRIAARLDGTLVIDNEIKADWSVSDIELKLGIVWATENTSTWRFRYDDIVLDLH
ncbi:hypothetical protein [Pendulispora albinea]|uniref:Uncharacterized protein n=1 Tax=Pendulispora albinea TaxID=2741071 RepID=A0ABZ2M3R5_9BACT